MNGFVIPRVMAALAAANVLLAFAYWAFGWYGWHACAGLLCVAAVLFWLAADMARVVRERLDRERQHRLDNERRVRTLAQLDRLEDGDVNIASIEAYGRRVDLPLNSRLGRAS